MYKIALSIVVAGIVCAEAAPGEYAAAGSAQIGGDISKVPSLFTFENGNVGVNFLGFQAAAGLGGLLTGNAAHGGLHAHASTPFGQAAQAGLAGSMNGKGKSVGGLYADATAGGGVAAGAGLAGTLDKEESHGISYAGSSAGGLYKETTKIKTVAPVQEVQVAPEKVTVVESKPQKTYIERTVIPNYEEKTIYVPSYVEKTVRVPTVVEQKVKVPAAPTVIEKTVDVPPSEVNFETSKINVVEHAPVTTIHHRKYHSHPHHHRHFYVGGYGSGYGGGGYSEGGITGTNSVVVQKTANPQLFQDIFNIPISTLGAVSKLVSGIAGGTSGSVAVSKSFLTY